MHAYDYDFFAKEINHIKKTYVRLLNPHGSPSSC